MAAGKFHWITAALERMANGEIDLVADTLIAVLLDENHTPSQDVHDDLADITGDEIGDGDYSRLTLTTKAVNNAGGVVALDFADLDFGDAVTIEAKYLYIFDDTHANDALIGFIDLNTATTSSTVSSTADDFDIAINASGALSLTRTAYSAGN